MIQSQSIGVGILDEDKMCVKSLSDFSSYKKNETTTTTPPPQLLSSTTISPVNEDGDGDDINNMLGNEKSLLDPEVERQGVLELMQLLSDDEKQKVPDSRMYVRHLRREKVSVTRPLPAIHIMMRRGAQERGSFSLPTL